MSNQPSNNNELQKFIENALNQIRAAIGTNHISDPIEFEIAVTKTSKTEGEVGIAVAGLDVADNREHYSKIKFQVYLKHQEGSLSNSITSKETLDFDPY